MLPGRHINLSQLIELNYKLNGGLAGVLPQANSIAPHYCHGMPYDAHKSFQPASVSVAHCITVPIARPRSLSWWASVASYCAKLTVRNDANCDQAKQGALLTGPALSRANCALNEAQSIRTVMPLWPVTAPLGAFALRQGLFGQELCSLMLCGAKQYTLPITLADM